MDKNPDYKWWMRLIDIVTYRSILLVMFPITLSAIVIDRVFVASKECVTIFREAWKEENFPG